MVRLGNQEPTFKTRIEYAFTDGPDAVELMRGYGMEFMPAQEMELSLYQARDKDGRYASKTICLAKPRQNGKSFAGRGHAAVTAAVEGKRVLYSAHHGKTVRKMFKMLCDTFKGTELCELLKPGSDGIYKAQGSEGIYLANGGLIEFQTRTASAARGDTYDVIIVDEAQELTDEQLDAMKPTTLASDSGDPQMIFLGTPPGPKCPGTVFRSFHDKAHADPDGCGIWWLEWAADEFPDMSDRAAVLELAYQTNPALGYRIREDVMEDAIATATSVDGFAREYLGWWSKGAALSVIPEPTWQAALTASPERKGLTCFAVKFSPDGRRGSLSACIKQPDGRFYVCAIDSRGMDGGVAWATEWLAAHEKEAAQIVIDGKAHSESLVRSLLDEGVPRLVIVQPGSSDVSDACAMFLNALNEGKVCHTGQGALDHSALNSCKRPIGRNGGWGFEAIGDSDPTIIESCALAYWQCVLTKRDPSRKLRIG